jgi:Fe-Mn family superoxide dismutase
MFTLPELGYDYNQLEPVIDAQTMEIHHTKHHQGYINKLNTALESHADLQDMSVEELLRGFDRLPAEVKAAVRNNGGGHANHTLFWSIMTPEDTPAQGEVVDAIIAKWGDLDSFKAEFLKAAATQFGSGWGWLVKNEEGELEVYGTPNQDSPYMHGHTPILGVDVWEHAYYLNYQNRRPDYLEGFWTIINWEQVNKNFLA